MTKQTKIVAGVLAGAALGATLAFVFNADKNSMLKEKAADWLCDLFSRSKDTLASAGNKLKDNIAKVKG